MGGTCTEHDKRSCSKYDVNMSAELAFFRWFEVIDESLPSIDKIGRVLNYVWLRWQGTCRQADLLSPSVVYELIPFESVKGLTYLARKDFAVDALSDYSSRKTKVLHLSGG